VTWQPNENNFRTSSDWLEAIPKSIANVLEPTLAAIPTALASLTGLTPTALPVAPQVALPKLTERQSALVGAPLEIEDLASPPGKPVYPADDWDEATSLAKPQTSIEFGDIASPCMNLLGTGKNKSNTVFGIHTALDKLGFFIGPTQIQISGNDLIISGKKYEGAEGLWNLIMNKEIKDESFTEDDWDKCKDIGIPTKALLRSKNDPNHPISQVRVLNGTLCIGKFGRRLILLRRRVMV
jgi:hypothetical protein